MTGTGLSQEEQCKLYDLQSYEQFKKNKEIWTYLQRSHQELEELILAGYEDPIRAWINGVRA